MYPSPLSPSHYCLSPVYLTFASICQVQNLKKIFESGEEMTKALLSIAEHLSNSTLEPSHITPKAGEKEPCKQNSKADEKPHWPSIVEDKMFRHLVNDATDLLNQYPLEDESGDVRELDEEATAKLNDYVARMAYLCQIHDTHNGTCSKGGRKGDDSDCRMAYPRLLVHLSTVKDAEGTFLLKRNLARLVPYVRAMVLACPCNHTMSFASEISRWMRDHHLWTEDVKHKRTQVRLFDHVKGE